MRGARGGGGGAAAALRSLAAYEGASNVYVILELCSGGDLLRRILKHSVFIEANARTYCGQIFSDGWPVPLGRRGGPVPGLAAVS